MKPGTPVDLCWSSSLDTARWRQSAFSTRARRRTSRGYRRRPGGAGVAAAACGARGPRPAGCAAIPPATTRVSAPVRRILPSPPGARAGPSGTAPAPPAPSSRPGRLSSRPPFSGPTRAPHSPPLSALLHQAPLSLSTHAVAQGWDVLGGGGRPEVRGDARGGRR